MICGFRSNTGTIKAGIGFQISDGKYYAVGVSGTTYTFGTAAVTLATSTWHYADIRVNTAANPWVVDVRFNGGTTDTVSPAYASGTVTGLYLGDQNSKTFDIYYDDFLMSATTADYPLGPGYVKSYIPNADGTHNIAGANDFERSLTGTDITNATTDAFELINDRPLPTTAVDFINGIAPPNATDYVEWQYEDSSESDPPRAVEAILAVHNANTVGSNAYQVTLREHAGGTTGDIFNGADAGSASISYKRAHFATVPGTSDPWTTTKFNALRSRFLVSDSAPDPYIDAAMLEAEFPDSGTSASITGVTATATAAGIAGSVSTVRIVSITGVTATAPAAGIAGSVAIVVNASITGVTATATAAGQVGSVSTVRIVSITGVTAAAPASGQVGSVAAVRNLSITGVTATATAAGIAGSVTAQRVVSITGVTATATAAGQVGAVATVRIVSITGVTATAPAAGIAGAVDTGSIVNASITGVTATATAAGQIGSVTAVRVVSITGTTATATAAGIAGVLTAVRIATITGATATATAAGMAGVLTAIRIVSITGATATATASGIAGALGQAAPGFAFGTEVLVYFAVAADRLAYIATGKDRHGAFATAKDHHA